MSLRRSSISPSDYPGQTAANHARTARQTATKDADVLALLTKLQPWADEVADAVAEELTDHHFKFSATADFFRAYVAKKGIEFEALREGWKAAQAGHWRAIFAEPAQADPFGLKYFEGLLGVGALHNKIDLPLKWYLGSYPTYLDAVRRQLRENPPKVGGEQPRRRGLRRSASGDEQHLLALAAERAEQAFSEIGDAIAGISASVDGMAENSTEIATVAGSRQPRLRRCRAPRSRPALSRTRSARRWPTWRAPPSDCSRPRGSSTFRTSFGDQNRPAREFAA